MIRFLGLNPRLIRSELITAEVELLGDLAFIHLWNTMAFYESLAYEFDLFFEPTGRLSSFYTVGDIYAYLDAELGPEFPENGMLTLTEDQFCTRYEPEADEEGCVYVQRYWGEDAKLLEEAVRDNRCWTMVEDDNGDLCIIEGNRFVNRIYHVITEKPLENPEWQVQVPLAEEPDFDEDDEEDKQTN